MRKVLMQYQYQGEMFPIWETELDDLQAAWNEMGLEQPEEPGDICFEGEYDYFLVVNGGF